jgi:hypothetical protein
MASTNTESTGAAATVVSDGGDDGNVVAVEASVSVAVRCSAVDVVASAASVRGNVGRVGVATSGTCRVGCEAESREAKKRVTLRKKRATKANATIILVQRF